jgi:hypothetical protein
MHIFKNKKAKRSHLLLNFSLPFDDIQSLNYSSIFLISTYSLMNQLYDVNLK